MAGNRRRGRIAAGLGAAALALGTAGCWPAPGQGPNRDAFNPHETTLTVATVGDLTEAWSAPLDGPVFELQNNPSGELVTGHGGVYVNDSGGAYRFDPATGARDWKVDLPEPPEGQIAEMGQVLVSGDDVLVGYGSVGDWWGEGAYAGTMVLDPVAGTDRGITIPAGQPMAQRDDDLLLTANRCTEGVACTATYSLVDVDTGFGSWGTIGLNLWRYAAPTLGADRVYSTTFRLEPSPTSLVQAHPLTGNPAAPLWVTDLGQFAGARSPVLSADGTTIYVGTSGAAEGHTMFALDAATGAVEWSTDVGTQVTAAPALAGGRLYVPTASGLVVLDEAGDPLWTAQAGEFVTAQPAVAGGVVYTGTSGGTVSAFDAAGCGAASCPALWSAGAGDGVVSAPVVSDGRLYVVSGTDLESGRVVAYEPEGP